MDLQLKTYQFITKKKLIRRSENLLVGVSGGADSVCLLDVLNKLKFKLGINLYVVHVNHQLRRSSKRDETFVKNLTKKLNLPFYLYRCPTVKIKKKISEDTARQWRLNFFLKTAKSIKADGIVLAHTQNDQAETVLMRLIRGSGLIGLRGMALENEIEDIRFIRPFLSVSRVQIEDYLKKNKLDFCIDETNLTTNYLRNKIRLKLLPHLVKEYNDQLPRVLLDLADTSKVDYDYIYNQANKVFIKVATLNEGKVKIKLKSFLKEPQSIQRMILRLAFEYLSSNLNQLSFVHINEVQEMILNRPDRSDVHWPQGLRVVKHNEYLEILQH